MKTVTKTVHETVFLRNFISSLTIQNHDRCEHDEGERIAWGQYNTMKVKRKKTTKMNIIGKQQ